jgi:dCMP deaminase
MRRPDGWWDEFFVGMAAYVATASKDPSTQTGCVVVRPAGGYNGFPRGVSDDDRLDDRKTKYAIVVHAEANAVLSAYERLDGCTAYVYPWPPCSSCAGILIQAGVSRVVAPHPTEEQIARWGESFSVARQMFSEASVELELIEQQA